MINVALYVVVASTTTTPCPLSLKYNEFNEIVSDMKGWNCNMEFNLSPNTKEKPNYIDLCTILNGEEPFQLPNHFNGIESNK